MKKLGALVFTVALGWSVSTQATVIPREKTENANASQGIDVSVEQADRASAQASTPLPMTTTGSTSAKAAPTPFEAFSGKIVRNKVRLRTEPRVDSEIVKECMRDDLFVVVGEENGFYGVIPPKGVKAYVFRTFVLDNLVEGQRVNVRLRPDTEAPVIGRLNAGDHVQGTVCAANNKWIEIDPPSPVRFFVSKEFVQKVGDANYIVTVEKQRDDAARLLNSAYLLSQSELRKPFEEINIDHLMATFDHVVNSYPDCPQQAERAKELRQLARDAYTQKQIAFLQAKASALAQAADQRNQQMPAPYQEQLEVLQKAIKGQPPEPTTQPQALTKAPDSSSLIPASPKTSEIPQITDKMAIWEPIEQGHYEEWLSMQQGGSLDDFYTVQQQQAMTLKGIVEPYSKPVKNKPGDYLLVDLQSHKPLAYLYSTRLNLQDYVGREVTLLGTPRPNNHFAYPAFFALSME